MSKTLQWYQFPYEFWIFLWSICNHGKMWSISPKKNAISNVLWFDQTVNNRQEKLYCIIHVYLHSSVNSYCKRYISITTLSVYFSAPYIIGITSSFDRNSVCFHIQQVTSCHRNNQDLSTHKYTNAHFYILTFQNWPTHASPHRDTLHRSIQF